jgi:hypothetical protein
MTTSLISSYSGQGIHAAAARRLADNAWALHIDFFENLERVSPNSLESKYSSGSLSAIDG